MLIFALAMLHSGMASALTFVINPIEIAFPDRESALTVKNNEAAPAVVELVFAPETSSDPARSFPKVSAYPPFATIPPGSTQTFRVRLMSPLVVPYYYAYRMGFRRLSAKQASSDSSLSVMVGVSLPLYLLPKDGVAKHSLKTDRTADGGCNIELANTGTTRIQYRGAVRQTGGNVSAKTEIYPGRPIFLPFKSSCPQQLVLDGQFVTVNAPAAP